MLENCRKLLNGPSRKNKLFFYQFFALSKFTTPRYIKAYNGWTDKISDLQGPAKLYMYVRTALINPREKNLGFYLQIFLEMLFRRQVSWKVSNRSFYFTGVLSRSHKSWNSLHFVSSEKIFYSHLKCTVLLFFQQPAVWDERANLMHQKTTEALKTHSIKMLTGKRPTFENCCMPLVIYMLIKSTWIRLTFA